MVEVLNIGDFIVLDSVILMDGRATFTSFEENIVGETSTRFFKREFRITVDDIFWSNWRELNNVNLSDKQYKIDGEATIEVRYTREGQNTTGGLVFYSITFKGDFESVNPYIPTIKESIFSDIYNEKETKTLSNNLFKKLYYYGIVPNYIERGDNLQKEDDLGFVNLFYSISMFFSLIFRFSESFENFKSNYNFLLQKVIQNDIFVNRGISIDDLLFLTSHMLDEARKRGSEMVFLKKNTVLESGSTTQIDGEFLRLLDIKEYDEMIAIIPKLEECNYFVGRNFPTWSGFPNYSKEISQDGFYNIDQELSYLISFDYSPIVQNNKLKIELRGYNENKIISKSPFIKSNTGNISNIFMNENLYEKFSNVDYKVECLLFSFKTEIYSDDIMNIGFGNNLTLNNSNIRFIKIIINTTGEVKNLKIQPLIVGTNIRKTNKIGLNCRSMCYSGKQENMLIISKNRNKNLSEEEVKNKITKNLIPYNVNDVIFLI